MKIRTCFFLFAFLMTSCSTLGDAKRRAAVPEADVARLLAEACAIYQDNRVLVLEFRQWAIVNSEKFPPALWERLQAIDAKLPLLEALGKKACAAAEAAAVFERSDISNLKGALELVVQIAGWLKQLGIL